MSGECEKPPVPDRCCSFPCLTPFPKLPVPAYRLAEDQSLMCATWERGPFCAEPLKPPACHFDSLLFLRVFHNRDVEGKILPGSSFLEDSSGLSAPCWAADRGSACARGWWGQPMVEAELSFSATP